MERLLNESRWYKNIARLLYFEEVAVATVVAIVVALASVDESIVVRFDGEAYQAFFADVVEN
jgi:hypothetical protein